VVFSKPQNGVVAIQFNRKHDITTKNNPPNQTARTHKRPSPRVRLASKRAYTHGQHPQQWQTAYIQTHNTHAHTLNTQLLTQHREEMPKKAVAKKRTTKKKNGKRRQKAGTTTGEARRRRDLLISLLLCILAACVFVVSRGYTNHIDDDVDDDTLLDDRSSGEKNAPFEMIVLGRRLVFDFQWHFVCAHAVC
jgi:hypothetical protein